MGRATPTDPDTASARLEAAFAANGASAAVALRAPAFFFAVRGAFQAVLSPEISFDGGTSWIPVARDTSGSPVQVSAPVAMALALPEAVVLGRVVCSGYVSGTPIARLSQ
jgi:hypothetical protein